MQTKPTKLIFKALTIEIIGAVLLSSFFYTIFFGLNETIQFFQWLCIPIIIGCVLTYTFGWLIGSRFTPNYQFKKWQGVAIIFALLLFNIIASLFIFSLTPDNDINEASDYVNVIFVFLLFGGLPTLILGLWLGNQLSKINVSLTTKNW